MAARDFRWIFDLSPGRSRQIHLTINLDSARYSAQDDCSDRSAVCRIAKTY